MNSYSTQLQLITREMDDIRSEMDKMDRQIQLIANQKILLKGKYTWNKIKYSLAQHDGMIND